MQRGRRSRSSSKLPRSGVLPESARVAPAEESPCSSSPGSGRGPARFVRVLLAPALTGDGRAEVGAEGPGSGSGRHASAPSRGPRQCDGDSSSMAPMRGWRLSGSSPPECGGAALSILVAGEPRDPASSSAEEGVDGRAFASSAEGASSGGRGPSLETSTAEVLLPPRVCCKSSRNSARSMMVAPSCSATLARRICWIAHFQSRVRWPRTPWRRDMPPRDPGRPTVPSGC